MPKTDFAKLAELMKQARSRHRVMSRIHLMDEVTIKGTHVTATSPEGQTVTMSLEELIETITAAQGAHMNTGIILPDGVKAVRSQGRITILVYERPPQVYNLKWIANNSPASFGENTRYRTVKIALPYLIVLAVFEPGPGNRLMLSHRNECFFRTAPLKGPDDELLYPALLNCSKFSPQAGHPLSWICTAKLDPSFLITVQDENARILAGLWALLRELLESGYNKSSEHHEESSWFTETVNAKVDRRITSVEAWEKATRQDRCFAINVPWLKTGMTLKQVTDRIYRNARAVQPKVTSASDIARILFNHATAH